MTVEQFILERSYLPKTGIYTLEEHLMAMQMSILGVCTALIIEDETENIQVIEVIENVSIADSIEYIEVEDMVDNIPIIEEIVCERLEN